MRQNIHRRTETQDPASTLQENSKSLTNILILGLGTRLLPYSNRPRWPHRLHQHSHHLPRRFPLRLRRQRRHHHMLWDLNESKHLYSLQAGDEIHALVFSPNRYWLCAATTSSITIFDLEKKSKVDELKPEYVEKGKKSQEPYCVSLAWSADGQTLFSGYTDGKVRGLGCYVESIRYAGLRNGDQ